MKALKLLLCTLLCACLLAGCGIDADACVLSSLDAVCRSDYAEYSRLTGMTTQQISEEQTLFIEAQADRLITILGGDSCSEEMRGRYVSFLKTVYASARYESDQTKAAGNEARITVYPITLLTVHTDELQEYADKFNAANEAFAYSSLGPQEYADQYLDGCLGLLGAHLASIEYGSGQTIAVELIRDDSGMYAIEPGTLGTILETMLPMPG